MKTQKLCITFAGAVGSSKSPIANYLSGRLSLPSINNDIIRTEVLEDFGIFDQVEYERRRNEQAIAILKSGYSFIYDASVDREWRHLKKYLEDFGYTWFVISLDLSKDFLRKLYSIKEYHDSLRRLDDIFEDHLSFLDSYGDDVGLRISDEQFLDRKKLSLEVILKNFSDA